METYHNKPLFTNHVTLLLGLILPKHSWIKKIVFGNKYYGVMKEKLSFLDIMMNRFGARKVRLGYKYDGWLMLEQSILSTINYRKNYKPKFLPKPFAHNLTYNSNILCMNKINLYKNYSSHVLFSIVCKFFKNSIK